jgi:hypothetical protein
MKAEALDGFPAAALRKAAASFEYKGYSALKKDELVKFIIDGGKAPAPTPGSARDVAAQLKAAKAAGKVTGAVSALSKTAGEAVLAQLKTAKGPIEAPKPTPPPGTAAYKAEWLKTNIDRTTLNKFLKDNFKITISSATVKNGGLTAAWAKFGPK